MHLQRNDRVVVRQVIYVADLRFEGVRTIARSDGGRAHVPCCAAAILEGEVGRAAHSAFNCQDFNDLWPCDGRYVVGDYLVGRRAETRLGYGGVGFDEG